METLRCVNQRVGTIGCKSNLVARNADINETCFFSRECIFGNIGYTQYSCFIQRIFSFRKQLKIVVKERYIYTAFFSRDKNNRQTIATIKSLCIARKEITGKVIEVGTAIAISTDVLIIINAVRGIAYINNYLCNNTDFSVLMM